SPSVPYTGDKARTGTVWEAEKHFAQATFPNCGENTNGFRECTLAFSCRNGFRERLTRLLFGGDMFAADRAPWLISRREKLFHVQKNSALAASYRARTFQICSNRAFVFAALSPTRAWLRLSTNVTGETEHSN